MRFWINYTEISKQRLNGNMKKKIKKANMK